MGVANVLHRYCTPPNTARKRYVFTSPHATLNPASTCENAPSDWGHESS